MEYLFVIILLLAFSFMAYWRGNPTLYMVVAGLAMMCGLYSPDALRALNYANFGMSVGLMLIFYSFVCIGMAYANLFKGPVARDNEEE